MSIRCNRPDAWFFPPESQTYQRDASGQLTIFVADPDDEPPEPDDYETLGAFEKAWQQWEITQIESPCDSSISVQVWEADSQMRASRSVLKSSDCAKRINGVKTSFVCASQASQSFQTCKNMTGGANASTPISSQLRLPASPSAFRESASEELISATASPQFSERSPNSSPDTSLSKMSEDCSPAQPSQERLDYILVQSLRSFKTSGSMRNGTLSAADNFQRPGLESDYCWLESPGALSSTGKGRPPGLTKLEVQLRSSGAIAPGEVSNPEFIESAYSLPIGWTDPTERRSALELIQEAQQSANADKPLEMP